MNLEKIRSDFPITAKWIYLNHAAVAPLSRPAARAMRRHLRDVEENGMVHIEDWIQLYRRARQAAAGLVGGRADEIALLKNTTEGLLIVANGLAWRPGDNAVIAAGQFPANVYPWLNLDRRGVEVRQVAAVDQRHRLDDFAAAIDARTRVVAVSSVDFLTGYRLDLPGLAQICRDAGALLCVDAIQSLGAQPMDAAAWGLDVVAADAHKWLLGPEGSALFYCSRRALGRLEVTAPGWASVESAFDFMSYDRTLYPDARRFECGTLNSVGIAGLKAAIDLLRGVGLEPISQRITALTERLCFGLEAKGYVVHSPRQVGETSGIVSFAGGPLAPEALYDRLRQEGVIATVRGGYLRLSPHFYNTEAEIDQAVDLLPAVSA